jgi:hypothetical protein
MSSAISLAGCPVGWTILKTVAACVVGLSLARAVEPAPAVAQKSTHSNHWSWQPLVRPIVPAGGHPIDAFVDSARRAHGLTANPSASPRELLRRVHFDLTGLPPTPDEIATFERDPSPERYRQLVDRLLASPHYGERWARHWLDVVRYTESQGFEYDHPRDNAWHYRDYVIRSFNADKPYDRFMREQVAGDVIEPVTSDGIIGAGLLVSGPWDQAGNAQANVTQRAITREEEMEDLVSVVGQTFLGVTIHCARCHDHKFDPVPIEDYYRVKAVFDGVRHGDRSIEGSAEQKARETAKQLRTRELAEARERVQRIEGIGAGRAAAQASKVVVEPGPDPWIRWTFDGSRTPDLAGEMLGGATVDGGNLRLPKAGAHYRSAPIPRDLGVRTLEAWVSLADLDQSGGAAISIENEGGTPFDALVFGERQSRKWTAGSEGFVRTRDLDAPEENSTPGQWIHMAAVYAADHTIALYRNGQPYGRPYNPGTPLIPYKAGKARVLLGLRHSGGGKPWLTGAIRRAAIHDRALSAEEVAASFRSGGHSIPLTEILARLEPDERTARDQALEQIARAQAALAAMDRPLPMAYVGRREQPKATHVLKRGDVLSPGAVVAAAGLSALKSLPAELGLDAEAPEAERRRRFADWLADPRNPLPARVLVNRVWQYHFGQGLVATPSDFGISGARPTHPELLDWLASEFIASGWSLKVLHRLILNSETYRQSAAARSEALSVDADNQWLWRHAPHRLEAEAVRDAMLTVSGRLNPQVGGPSFKAFTNSSYGATFYHLFFRDEPAFNRRTVYRMNINSGKEPFLDAFDCPDPSVKTPRRGVTTTPLQALGLMNGEFVQAQANALAARATALASNDPAQSIEHAYRLALGRAPSAGERDAALAAERDRGLPSVCWVLLNSTEFLYVQ